MEGGDSSLLSPLLIVGVNVKGLGKKQTIGLYAAGTAVSKVRGK